MRPLRVFLCHASQDKPAVRELYKRLKTEDWIDPWLDEEKLSFGQYWTTAIEDALSEADVVIIFLSKNSVQKEGFVQRELNYAWELSLEKPRNVIFLIPFRLDDCQIPRYLGSRQWGDYFGEKKESTYQTLLRSLKQRHQQKLQLEDKENAEREQVERQGTIEGLVKKIDDIGADKGAERERFAREKLNNEVVQKVILGATQREGKGEISKIEMDRQNRNVRLAGFAWSIILFLVLGGIGLNSLFNKLPEVTSTPVTQISTESSILPTETSVPFTPTLIETSTPSPTPTTVLGIGSSSRSLKDDMLLVYVPAGEFTMGSDDGDSDEKPQHQVYLDAFWIDQTEVTNAMYAKCVEANQCEPPDKKQSSTHSSYFGNPLYDEYPVIYVSWDYASDYCSWVGRALPTEAHWDKAARGLDGWIYPWGIVL